MPESNQFNGLRPLQSGPMPVPARPLVEPAVVAYSRGHGPSGPAFANPSPMSEPKSRTTIKLQPTARAYRIIPLCTRGRSICLQQTETIASQAVSYYCFIPRPPEPCAPPAPYGPGSAPAALAPYLPLGRLHQCRPSGSYVHTLQKTKP